MAKTIGFAFASVCLGLALAGCGAGKESSSTEPQQLVRPILACPKGLTGYTVRPLTLDEAVQAARRVILGKKFYIQGEYRQRTRANTPVIEVVQLGPVPDTPEVKRLYVLASERCGRLAAWGAWAVVFGEGISVLCCLTPTVFVTATTQAVYVFRPKRCQGLSCLR